MEIRPGAIFAISGTLTSPFGAYAAQQFPEHSLLIVFWMLMLCIAIRLWYQASKHSKKTHALNVYSALEALALSCSLRKVVPNGLPHRPISNRALDVNALNSLNLEPDDLMHPTPLYPNVYQFAGLRHAQVGPKPFSAA